MPRLHETGARQATGLSMIRCSQIPRGDFIPHPCVGVPPGLPTRNALRRVQVLRLETRGRRGRGAARDAGRPARGGAPGSRHACPHAFGKKSCAWIGTRPPRRVAPAYGSTSAASGKSAGIASGARSRGAAELSRSRACAGRRASDRSNAMALPSLVGTGAHSIPVPLVTAAGFPAATGTRHRWRRSMSSWFSRATVLRRAARTAGFRAGMRRSGRSAATLARGSTGS